MLQSGTRRARLGGAYNPGRINGMGMTLGQRVMGWFREPPAPLPRVDCVDLAECVPLMLFDGDCGMCNGLVQFIHARDRGSVIRFAALQSQLGQSIATKAGIEPGTVSTMILVESRGISTRSTAALRLARYFGPPLSLGVIGLWIPRVVRDVGYRLVARLRFRIFGHATACVVDPALSARFVRESRGSISHT